MNRKNIFLWSVVIALGGFLFGFIAAVLSCTQQSVQKFWSLNIFENTLTISIAPIVTGSLSGSISSDKIGSKKTLYIIAILSCYHLPVHQQEAATLFFSSV